ncbi:N-acetylglucosamine-6-phosphate deacetylase [Allgaiera indica]|uniref:N-acetylglucosamine-6-phosphate deacetylase n=1 Tax=Allgaiera indica TaxID=765699 RepID=UPI0035712189
MLTIYSGARIFDGERLHDGMALVVEAGHVAAILPEVAAPPGRGVALDGGVLAPGMIDLQVNGGGGVMLGARNPAEEIRTICAAHARLGSTGLLPTLITAPRAVTRAVLEAGVAAARAGVPGFLGLHLEGPHIDPRRNGAHAADLIRPMDEDDLQMICAAAARMPALMVTVAPSAATPDQIARLARAGVTVALGHSDCTLEEARAAFAAGARGVTHLFNAMSGLSHRAPGLVGAALDEGEVWAGLIADLVHVAPEALRIALAAKRGPGRLFLVSDAMAVAGTDLESFTLGGREIRRETGEGAGRLTLANGTLAGADITLPQAVANIHRAGGLDLAPALAMATSLPAACVGLSGQRGRLTPGTRADFVHLDADLALKGTWIAGRAVV